MPVDPQQGGYACQHLVGDIWADYRQFTGVGVRYNLLCDQCAKNLDTLAENLREVDENRFYQLDFCGGIIGQPEVFDQPTDLKFAHETITLSGFASSNVLDIKPVAKSTDSQWIALLKSGDLIRLDLTKRTKDSLTKLSTEFMESKPPFALHISADGVFAAVVQDKSSEGMVIDTQTSKITMPLNRGKYRPEHTRFPVAFFEYEGRTLMVHGSDWNRLDVSNPKTGELLTEREYEVHDDKKSPEHYLDYFHDLPIISPDGNWIAEDGWVWHPAGITIVWNMRQWLEGNKWEAEDGTSWRKLNQRDYYWGGPLCWVDDTTLAVWGAGEDDDWLIPAIELYDAETGRRIRWFAGVSRGTLFFDKHLFSVTATSTEIWNLESGARLATVADFTPLAHHPQTHEFLSRLSDGSLQLSRLIDEPNPSL